MFNTHDLRVDRSWRRPPAGADRSSRLLSTFHPLARSGIADLTKQPWRSIALVGDFNAQLAQFIEVGTGFLYKPDVVVTAGHLTADDGNPRFVALAFDGRAPTGGYRTSAYARHATLDLGVVLLPEAVSRPPLPVFSGNLVAGGPVTLAGYGYDYDFLNPEVNHMSSSEFRMTQDKEFILSLANGMLYHDVNSDPGDSGGPLMVPGAQGLEVAAIHLSDQTVGTTGNLGLVLSPAVIAQLDSLIQTTRAANS